MQKEDLGRLVNALSSDQIRALLSPVRNGLLSDKTQLHLISDSKSQRPPVVITVDEFLREVNPSWRKWVLSCDTHALSHKDRTNLQLEVSASEVNEFARKLSSEGRKRLLQSMADGLLTEDTAITTTIGTETRQITLGRLMQSLVETEYHRLSHPPNILHRFLFAVHYSSFDFSIRPSEIALTHLREVRHSLPIWYTVLFFLSTMLIFAGHVSSQLLNFHDLESISSILNIFIIILSSLVVGFLLYTTLYIIVFILHCETSLQGGGLRALDPIIEQSCIYRQFGTHQYWKLRLWSTRITLFALFWYSLALLVFETSKQAYIYSSLLVMVGSFFAFFALEKIAVFLMRCATIHDGRTLISRHSER